MAGPALSRWSKCLACLRRTVFGGNNSGSSVVGAVSTAVQIRAKSTKRRPQGQDVAVRLLSDIRTYGRKNAIMRVSPGRMRYQWSVFVLFCIYTYTSILLLLDQFSYPFLAVSNCCPPVQSLNNQTIA
ncbi:hypothetical protein B0T26DRAFT_12971 [Lasiosphaeria miniovina]|uniref:Ribosomal protein L9 domain-containing protein n=1 Tax=Lasiosphaeria miniovina TaxID=1954250 RepID=A0AA40BFK1_9PEZI|nr:uncharacterized protein B0T26DRAFT_12971 [Lasiosphaeria miniovina]KAK0733337.1 hypothetical protein B0T26DRAFT_12971 [Lasiosphaeria miniovina]